MLKICQHTKIQQTHNSVGNGSPHEEDARYTKDVLPWVLTEDLSVKWDISRFNKTLMDLEPHLGVPRYVTRRKRV